MNYYFYFAKNLKLIYNPVRNLPLNLVINSSLKDVKPCFICLKLYLIEYNVSKIIVYQLLSYYN